MRSLRVATGDSPEHDHMHWAPTDLPHVVVEVRSHRSGRRCVTSRSTVRVWEGR